MSRLLSILRAYGPPLVARVFGLLVQTLVGWLTLHYASPADLGVYYVFVAWTTTLMWVLGFGLSEQALRTVSVVLAENGATQARKLGWISMTLALLSGATSFAVLELASRLPEVLAALNPSSTGLIWSPKSVPSPLLTSVGVAFVLGARTGALVLKAYGKPTFGLYAEYVLPFLPLMIGSMLLVRLGGLDGSALIMLYVSGGLITVVIVALVPAPQMGVESQQAAGGVVAAVRRLADGAGAQWLAVGIQSVLLNLPLITVSALAGEAAAGIFGLCTRLAAMLGISTDVVISMRAPAFAEFHSKADYTGLTCAFKSSRRGAIAITLPVFLALWIFATPVLGFFGVVDVSFAREVLLVLLIGRLVYAFVGPVSYFLWMIRAFREEIQATAIALVVLIAGVIVISRVSPPEPTLALAFATTLSLSLRFVLQYFITNRKTALSA